MITHAEEIKRMKENRRRLRRGKEEFVTCDICEEVYSKNNLKPHQGKRCFFQDINKDYEYFLIDTTPPDDLKFELYSFLKDGKKNFNIFQTHMASLLRMPQ